MWIGFKIRFPYKKQINQSTYICKDFSLTKNKSLEIQVSTWGNAYTLIGFDFCITRYQSHAGISLELELLNKSLIINFYDNRHWDYDKGEWVI